jgi:predicted Co/Zn/Cd cation transporter (cation efflux family)
VKEFVVYTLARLGLFVASYAVVVGIYLLVTGGHQVPILWPLLVAAVLSSIASVYLLKDMRERFAQVIDRRARAASERLEASRSKEDTD